MKNVTQHKLMADIEPITVHVKREYLENFENGFGSSVKGTLQAVWSYPGHQPTFTVLLHDGTVYSYLPVAAFTTGFLACLASISPQEGCNTYCPSDNFVLYSMKMFQEATVLCYDSSKHYLGVGEYYFSMEWPNENDVVHLICVNNQFRLIPNHKLLCGPKELAAQIKDNTAGPPLVLPKWKKLRQEWTR